MEFHPMDKCGGYVLQCNKKNNVTCRNLANVVSQHHVFSQNIQPVFTSYRKMLWIGNLRQMEGRSCKVI